MSSTGIEWQMNRFDDLAPRRLYEVIALRERVFVVEQNSLYQDCDGKDLAAWHLLGTSNGEIVAYCRILAAGVRFKEVSIGRVVVHPDARGQGAGKALNQEAIRQARSIFGPVAIRISAQAHLEKFYGEFGFVRASALYLEDTIPHIEMLLTPKVPQP